MSLLQPVSDDDNPMILSENQQGNSILEKLRLQALNEMFCDVIIFVENSKFTLHRNVLASFSPYFERFFKSNAVVKEKFSVTSHSAEIFKYFVNYMYTGTIVIHKQNVNELIELAHRLEVDKLKMHCADYLERHIDLNNCLKVKNTADKYDIQSLSKQIRLYIKSNVNDILNQHLLLEVDAFELDLFLSEMDLGLSPVQTMGIILDWVRYDIPNRERQLTVVVKHIKCTQLDTQYLTEIIESNHLFITSEISLYIMLKHFNDCGLAFERYLSLLEELSRKYSDLTVEKEPDLCENIQKLGAAMKRRKKKRLLRGNPIARLAALRSALLLRRKTAARQRRTIKRQKEFSKLIKIDEAENSGPLKCHLCAHFASDTTALEHHLSGVHSRDVTYKCGVCGYVCQWNNLYLEHIRGHFPGPPYKCDSCDFTCDRLNTVMTHRSEHAEEKTFKCSYCSFRCRSQTTLQAHSKCHSAEKMSGRGYVCDVCGFSTKFLSHLVAHNRIHSADVYRCSYPHCKFTTGKKTQLGSHAKSHQQANRPHCCQICGRGFLEKSHLVRHERIHLEEKPFKCHECDYASSRRDKLKEHQARHHGDHASAKVPYKARPHKKSSQLYPDNYSPGESSVRGHHGSHSSSTSGEMADVISQHHNLPLVNTNAYPIFTSADPHHAATSSAFHQQQLVNSSGRGKEHRSVHQSTAAAVTAAMMLDPRFHHSNSGGGPYLTPVPGVVAQASAQPNHQVSEYPTALMSLF